MRASDPPVWSGQICIARSVDRFIYQASADRLSRANGASETETNGKSERITNGKAHPFISAHFSLSSGGPVALADGVEWRSSIADHNNENENNSRLQWELGGPVS